MLEKCLGLLGEGSVVELMVKKFRKLSEEVPEDAW